MEIKNVIIKEKINSSEYININTGELLQSEKPNITSVNKVFSNLKIIDSKEYIVIDSAALRYISQKFSNAELSRVVDMANMVQGQYNLVSQEDKTPHVDKTLSVVIDYNSPNKYKKFMDKLLRAGVIYYLIGYKNNEKVKYIMLNPYLARKSKTFDIQCLEVFSSFLAESKLRKESV